MSTQRIGRYEVIRTLPGEPPSYLAHAAGAESCLLRRIGPVPADAVERAVHEVGLCASLAHPTVSSAEAFADGDHVVIAVPEREGATLAQLFDRLQSDGRSLPEAAVAHVVKELAAAFAATHQASLDDDLVTICHGFLSPAWIWLGWDGTVQLDAVGLASVADSPGLRGDAGFDAPERRRGGKPTPRADVYSLGTLAWALAAGEVPPAEPSVAALEGRLSPALAAVVAQALEPSLGKRKLTAVDIETAFAAAAVDGKKSLATALITLRKGTSVLGTPRAADVVSRPAAAAESVTPAAKPVVGAGSATKPFARPGATLVAGTAPTATPAATPRLPGAVLPSAARPAGPLATPRAGTPAPGPVAASPVAAGSPLGSRLPPPRAKGTSSAPPDDDLPPPPPPGDDLPPPTAALGGSSRPPSTASKPAVSPAAPRPSAGTPAPLPGARGPLGSSPAVGAPRPRLPSLSAEARTSRPAAAVEEELSWGKADESASPAKSDASSLDAALLGDLGSPDAAPSDPSSKDATGGSAPLRGPGASTQPSRTSDAPPPSVDSVRAEHQVAASSSLLDVSLEDDMLGLPPPPPPEPAEEFSDAPPSKKVTAPSAGKVVSPAATDVLPPVSALPVEPPAPSKPISWAKALGLVLVTAGAVFGGGVWWTMRHQQLPAPPTPSDVEAPTSSATASAAPTASAQASAEPAPSASAQASAEPAPSASAQASASAAPTADAAAAPAIDPSTLAPNQGVLTVHFAGDPAAEVYFFANALGKVEQPLKVPCDKSLFLRVGTRAKPTDPPRWISDGKPFGVKCKALNEVTIAPKP